MKTSACVAGLQPPIKSLTDAEFMNVFDVRRVPSDVSTRIVSFEDLFTYVCVRIRLADYITVLTDLLIPEGPFRCAGLINDSNFCYQNAGIQLLLCASKLFPYLNDQVKTMECTGGLVWRSPMLLALQTLFHCMSTSPSPVRVNDFLPNSFLREQIQRLVALNSAQKSDLEDVKLEKGDLEDINRQLLTFDNPRQQATDEWLMLFMRILNQCKIFPTNMFMVNTNYQIMCRNCRAQSKIQNHAEPFYHIPLERDARVRLPISTLLRKSLATEFIADSKCEACHRKGQFKDTFISAPEPAYVIFSLKRLVDDVRPGAFQPEFLNIDVDPDPATINGKSYICVGAVVHSGGTGGGHYIAYRRKASDGSRWKQLNDTRCADVQTTEINTHATLLMYEQQA